MIDLTIPELEGEMSREGVTMWLQLKLSEDRYKRGMLEEDLLTKVERGVSEQVFAALKKYKYIHKVGAFYRTDRQPECVE